MEPNPLRWDHKLDREKLRYYFSQGYDVISAGLAKNYLKYASLEQCVEFGWLIPCSPVGRYQTECYRAGESLKRELTVEPN